MTDLGVAWKRPLLPVWLVYAIVAVLLAIPVLTSTVPLGADDIPHLARIYVRAHLADDFDLQRFFAIKPGLVPYLGMDLLLTPLARVLPIMLTGKIFILALVWGLVIACAVVQRALTGRFGIEPAAAGLIAWNGLMAWGLLNYVLGLDLALLSFAAWHAARSRSWFIRLPLFAGCSTALYLTHIMAFGTYGAMVCGYEAFGRRRAWRAPWTDWLVLCGQAAPAVLLFVALNARDATLDHRTVYDVVRKLAALKSPFVFRADVDSGLLVALTVYFSFRKSLLICDRLALAPAAVLLAIAIVLPHSVLGVALVDYRFPVPAVCLLLAGSRLANPSPSRRAWFVAAVLLLACVRVTDVASAMRRCNADYAEMRGALTMLPRGAVLTEVRELTDPRPGSRCTLLPVYEHVSSLITIDRSGYSPDFFSRVTSVAVRDGLTSDAQPMNADAFVQAPPEGYVLWLHFGHRRQAPPGLERMYEGRFFDLWAVSRSYTSPR